MSTPWRDSGRCCGRDSAHRGIPRETLPLYLGFFEFVHDTPRPWQRVAGGVDRAAADTTLQSILSLLFFLNDWRI